MRKVELRRIEKKRFEERSSGGAFNLRRTRRSRSPSERTGSESVCTSEELFLVNDPSKKMDPSIGMT